MVKYIEKLKILNNKNSVVKKQNFEMCCNSLLVGKKFHIKPIMEITEIINGINQTSKIFINKKTINKDILELLKYLKHFKEKTIGFWLNEFKNEDPTKLNSHNLQNFKIPYISWIDIDFHKTDDFLNFKEDIGNPLDFYEKLKKDEHVFILGRTLSKNMPGIRIIVLVDSIYNFNKKDNKIEILKEKIKEFDEEIYNDEDLLEEVIEELKLELLEYDEKITNIESLIYKSNQNIVKQYFIEKYSLKEGRGYLDDCSDKLSQPTFPIREKGSYMNIKCKNFYNYNIIYEKKQTVSSLDQNEINNENDKYLIQLIKDNFDFSKMFKTYDEKLLAIIKHSNQRKVWYHIYKDNYKGTSMKTFLINEHTFYKKVESSKNLTFATSLFHYVNKNK